MNKERERDSVEVMMEKKNTQRSSNENPYRSPEHLGEAPKASKRAAPTKIPGGVGLALVICGIAALVVSLPQFVMTVLGAQLYDFMPALTPDFEKTIAFSKAVAEHTYISSVVLGLAYLILSALALHAGRLLRKNSERGRRLALVWAKAAVVYLAASVVVFFPTTPSTSAGRLSSWVQPALR